MGPRAAVAIIALAGAVPVAAEAQAPVAVCPVVTPAQPQMEGVAQRVIAGQHNPCPPPDRAREDFVVTTYFGDGTVSETPYDALDGLWSIGGVHAYRRAGTYEVVGTATDRRTGEQLVVRRVVRVPNAPLTPRRTATPRFSTHHAVRRVVARFRDGNRLAAASDHSATVSWGDGSRSNASVVRAPDGAFAVVAAHRYRTPARVRITVTIRDDRGAALRVRAMPRIVAGT
jgi:hypothetical protein